MVVAMRTRCWQTTATAQTSQHLSLTALANPPVRCSCPSATARSCNKQSSTTSIIARSHAPGRRRSTIESVAAAAAHAAAASRSTACRCTSTGAGGDAAAPMVVVEGDVVTFHMTCKGDDGQVLESSRTADEPLSFEIGAGEITGNPLFQAFDGALRGLGVQEVIELEISGGDWKQELLFSVPRDHPEIERLEGRYKNMGGLQKDLAVELANGNMAVVVEATQEYVKLDANNMMSGKKLLFELEVISIERSSV